jgi:glycosyltransferase involved in cell wall biosynthesis
VPLVSVVMAVRDGEPYVASAVQSVLAQTLTDLELIVVDDGSSDTSIDSARGVADARVTFVEGPLRGPDAARNVGVAASSAPWIAFMDADDISAPSRLSEQLSALTTDGSTLSAVSCFLRAIDERGDRIVDPPQLQHPDEIAAASYSFMPVAGPALMMARTAFDEVGGYPEGEDSMGVGDYEIVCRLLRARFRIGNVGSRLYLYRRHPAQITRTRRDPMARAALAVRRRHWELAPPSFSVGQVRRSRVGHARLHASVFAQLAIGYAKHGRWASAAKTAFAVAIYNPRGVLELMAGRRSGS